MTIDGGMYDTQSERQASVVDYLLKAVVFGAPQVNTTLLVGSPKAPPRRRSSKLSMTARWPLLAQYLLASLSARSRAAMRPFVEVALTLCRPAPASITLLAQALSISRQIIRYLTAAPRD
jgi:hypothetical protein